MVAAWFDWTDGEAPCDNCGALTGGILIFGSITVPMCEGCEGVDKEVAALPGEEYAEYVDRLSDLRVDQMRERRHGVG